MQPEKAQKLTIHKKSYNENKKETLKTMITLTISLTFIERMHKISKKLYKERMMKIHSNLICKRWIKNLINSNRMKFGTRVRNKMSMDLNLSAISCILWE